MTSAAARKRRYRQRQRDGRIVLAVEVDEVETSAALVEAGYLKPQDADDRAKLAEALSRATVHILPAE